MDLSIVHYLTPTTATVHVRPLGVIEDLDVSYPIENQLSGLEVSTCGKYYVFGLSVFPRVEVAAAIGKLAALLTEISKHVKPPPGEKLVGLIDVYGEYRLLEEELYNNIGGNTTVRPGYTGTQACKGFTLIYDETCGPTPRRVVVGAHGERKCFTFHPNQTHSYHEAVTINGHSYNSEAIAAFRSQLTYGKLTGWDNYSFSISDEGCLVMTYKCTGTVCPPLKRSDLLS